MISLTYLDFSFQLIIMLFNWLNSIKAKYFSIFNKKQLLDINKNKNISIYFFYTLTLIF